MGYMCTFSRAHPFPQFGNSRTDCAEISRLFRGPLAMCFTQDGDICFSAGVTVHTFKHIYSLPLVYLPKCTLLVAYNGNGGVPQGSILGPLLLNEFVKTIQKGRKNEWMLSQDLGLVNTRLSLLSLKK